MNFLRKVKDTIEDMRYGSGGTKALYWFIKIGSITLAVLIVVVIVLFIYTKVKGIQIISPF